MSWHGVKSVHEGRRETWPKSRVYQARPIVSLMLFVLQGVNLTMPRDSIVKRTSTALQINRH